MDLVETVNHEYLRALRTLRDAGLVTAPRRMSVREVFGFTFEINPCYNEVTLPGFETNVEYAEEELKWYYSGSNRIDFSDTIKRTWEKFSDDGITVNSAYGYRIFGKDPKIGINQWDWVVKKLREDPDSRQCVININSAYDKEKPTKDLPCTMYLHVFLRDGNLDWHTYMRSQDIYYGTRNDIYCFTQMQKRMASELNVGVGKYFHHCGSLHIYEKHWDKMDKLLEENK